MAPIFIMRGPCTTCFQTVNRNTRVVKHMSDLLRPKDYDLSQHAKDDGLIDFLQKLHTHTRFLINAKTITRHSHFTDRPFATE